MFKCFQIDFPRVGSSEESDSIADIPLDSSMNIQWTSTDSASTP